MKSTRGSVLAVLALTAVGTGCTTQSELVRSSHVGHATFRYTCCRQSDIARVRHPGDVVRIHWIVVSGPPSSTSGASPVTLAASLRGPFASVAVLKTSVTGQPLVSAAPVRTNDRAGGEPVSVLTIPTSAGTGAYNLTTAVKSQTGAVSSASVIRVAAQRR